MRRLTIKKAYTGQVMKTMSGDKEMYLIPEMQKMGNIKELTFHDHMWNTSLGDCGSDSCSSDSSDDSSS